MIDKFFIELNDLLDKCDLTSDERAFLEQLAEYMAFPDKDINGDPRTIHKRSFRRLKEKQLFGSYQKLIYDYQKKILGIVKDK